MENKRRKKVDSRASCTEQACLAQGTQLWKTTRKSRVLRIKLHFTVHLNRRIPPSKIFLKNFGIIARGRYLC